MDEFLAEALSPAGEAGDAGVEENMERGTVDAAGTAAAAAAAVDADNGVAPEEGAPCSGDDVERSGVGRPGKRSSNAALANGIWASSFPSHEFPGDSVSGADETSPRPRKGVEGGVAARNGVAAGHGRTGFPRCSVDEA